MAGPVMRRDSKLIDAIEAIDPEKFEGTVWRVVREGRDPTQGSASGGRWDDETFDVLYTSLEKDGAIAEMYFHLRRGQPIAPSKPKYRLHEIDAQMDQALNLLDLNALAEIGIDVGKYGRLSYEERQGEYPRTQEIAEVAHFMEFDGLLVPCARWNCGNAVLFCDRVIPEGRIAKQDHGLISFNSWASTNKVSI